MFIELKVVKKAHSLVYVEVPDGTNLKDLWHAVNYKAIGRIAEDTVGDYDWDDYGWEEDIDVIGIKQVSEEEATQFEYGKMTA